MINQHEEQRQHHTRLQRHTNKVKSIFNLSLAIECTTMHAFSYAAAQHSILLAMTPKVPQFTQHRIYWFAVLKETTKEHMQFLAPSPISSGGHSHHAQQCYHQYSLVIALTASQREHSYFNTSIPGIVCLGRAKSHASSYSSTNLLS